MAYCSFCNVDGLPEATNGNTYCPFCGKLIKEIKPAPPIHLYGSDSTTSVSNPSIYSGSSSYSGGRYSSKTPEKNGNGNEAFTTTVILALIAWYLFGSTAGMLVMAIGSIYMLRHFMKLIIVVVVAIIGFSIAENVGINGMIGLFIAGVLANFVINKLIGRK